MSKIYHVKKTSFDSSIPDWSKADILTDFSYPWSKDTAPETSFRALWDADRLYFRFDAVDPDINIYSNSNRKMDVALSDRVEIFFKSNGQLTPYYCLEIDPSGRVMDFEARFYRQFNYDWNWPDDLRIKSKINADGYSVEGSVSFKSLKELGILNNATIEAGLYRANCTELQAQEATFEWISWVNPQTAEPDFHVATSFGSLILLD